MELNDVISLGDAEYVSEVELSEALGRPIPTLRTWAARRRGPPRTAFGRAIFYRVGGLKRWLKDQERDFDAERERPRRKVS